MPVLLDGQEYEDASTPKERIAITEVVTESLGGSAHVQLSSNQLTKRQRKQLQRPIKRPRLLRVPCQINIDLRLQKFPPKNQRSEMYIELAQREKVLESLPPTYELQLLRGLRPQKVELGQPIRLDCQIEVIPPFRDMDIKWFRNDEELTDDRYKQEISEEGEVSLEILRSQLSDEGQYRVEIEVPGCSLESSTEVKVLFEKPNFSRTLRDVKVLPLGPATLACTVRGRPRPEVEWLMSGVKLSDTHPRYQKLFQDEDLGGGLFRDASLVVDRVLGEDATKLFTCRAWNEAGEDQTSGKIIIEEFPTIVTPIKDKRLRRGEGLNFSVVARGWPKVKLSWRLNGQPVGSEENLLNEKLDDNVKPECIVKVGEWDADKGGLIESTLEVKVTSQNEVGRYEVVASNEAGEERSQARVSFLPEAPEFVELFHDQTIVEEDRLILRGRAKGFPKPTIKWFRNDLALVSSEECLLEEEDVDQDEDMVDCSLVLPSASLSHGGMYKCVAENLAGDSKCVARLDVKVRNIKPEFLKGPDDVTVTEGEDAIFDATVSGIPKPEISWHREDNKLKADERILISSSDGEKSHRLHLKSTKLVQSGRYRIKAVNVAGETTADCNLLVKEKLWGPSFIDKLEDKEEIEGGRVTFSCSVSGKPIPEIIWYHDNHEVKGNARMVSTVSENPDVKGFKVLLTCSDLELTDRGSVRVVAKNSEGEISSEANLHVIEKLWPPKFIEELRDVEELEGKPVKMTCRVTGKPDPKFKWYHGDQQIKAGGRLIFVEEYKGEEITLLTLDCADLQLNDSGFLKVVATNSQGQAETSAQLKVIEKLWMPQFLDPLEDKEEIEGGSVAFSCKIFCKPKPEITWHHGDKEIKPNERMLVTVEETPVPNEYVLLLNINKLELLDTNLIKVRAKNSQGEMEAVANLHVIEKLWAPKFLDELMDMEEIEHGRVKLECRATGKPQPTFKWFHKDQEIKAGGRLIYGEETQSEGVTLLTLDCQDLQLSDAGFLKVVATNSQGQAETSAQLKVIEKLWLPQFFDPLEDKEEIEGGSVVFSCKVFCKPKPEITWYHGDKEIKSKDRATVSINETNVPNEYVLSLNMTNLELADRNMVKVKARNSEGEIDAAANLNVLEKLWPPEFLEGLSDKEEIEHGKVKFQCRVTGKPQPKYKWCHKDQEIKAGGRVIYGEETQSEGVTLLTLDCQDLMLSDSGFLKVVATNSEGQAETSAQLKVIEKLWSPEFVDKLEDKEELEGGRVEFSCTVFSKPAPSIKWFHGDKEIKIEERKLFYINPLDDNKYSVSLNIIDLILADRNKITIKATNSQGEISHEAKLNVLEKLWPPTIMEALTDQEALEDERLRFTCRISAKPLPKITWYHDGNQIQVGGRMTYDVVEDKDELLLTLDCADLKLSDRAEVKVVAENTEGSADSSARLGVIERLWPPVFKEKLENGSEVEEKNVVFKCSVNGKPLPKIRWYHNTKEIKTGGRFIMGIKEWDDGVTEELELNCTDLKLLDIGEIKVVAMNSEGTAENSANLSVIEKLWLPKFMTPLEDKTEIEHGSVEFMCEIEGKPLPEITWSHKGKLITAGDRFKIETSANGLILKSTLQISDLELNDIGEVEISAKNSEGLIKKSAQLTVIEKLWPPFFKEPLSDVEQLEDGKVNFRCVVGGKPKPNIIWFYRGNEVASIGRMKTETKTLNDLNEMELELEIDHIKLEDAGEIKIIAKNSEGVVNTSAKLRVIEKLWAPVIVEPLEDLKVIEEGTVTFKGKVHGKPRPAVAWYQGDKELKPDVRWAISSQFLNDGISVESHLECSHVLLDDSAEFRLVAHNTEGSNQTTGKLTVQEKLWAPVFVKHLMDVEEIEEKKASFFCQVHGKPKPKLTWYIGDIKLDANERRLFKTVDLDDGVSVTSNLEILKLILKDSGNIKVVAENSEGKEISQANFNVKEKLWSPVFTEPIVDVKETEENSAVFKCTVHGKPRPTLKWYRLNDEIKPNDNVSIKLTNLDDGITVTSSLDFSKLKLTDASELRVEAKNSEGMANSIAKLSVLEKLWAPEFTEKLQNLESTEDDRAIFKCKVNAKPLPKITWFLNDRELSSGDVRIIMTSKPEGDGFTLALILELQLLKLADIGELKAVAENSEGKAETKAKLSVKERLWPPLFTKKIEDREEVEENSAKFTCTITGKPTPEVSWFWKGKSIDVDDKCATQTTRNNDGTLLAEFQINNLELSDFGEVKVRAKNSEGEAFCTAYLSVRERFGRPYFLEELKDQIEIEEGQVKFGCKVRGKPRPDVKWYKDGMEVLPSEDRILISSAYDRGGDLTLSLIRSNLHLSDAGEIKAVATNSEGSASSTARLYVNEKLWPPIFIEALSNKIEFEEGTVKFQCKVQGKPVPKIEWYHKDKEVKSSDRNILLIPEYDGILLTMEFSDIKLSDAGEIRVKAFNDLGQAKTDCILTVKEKLWPPLIIVPLKDQICAEDGDVELSCVVQGKPEPSVTWYHNGCELKSCDMTSLKDSDGLHLTLKLDDLRPHDAGKIKVIARNSEGEAFTEASITVKEKLWPPAFITELADNSVVEEGDAEFVCKVTGRPLPEITWYRDGVEIQHGMLALLKAVSAKEKFCQDLNARLCALPMGPGSVISVIAKNSEGSATSKANLFIKEKLFAPKFIDGLNDRTVMEEESTEFACRVRGKPKPVITWYHNGKAIAYNERKMKAESDLGDDSLRLSLELDNIELNHAGSIEVVAENTEGTVKSQAKLHVKEKLWPPVIITHLQDLSVLEDDSAELICRVKGKPLPDITWFKGTTEMKSVGRTTLTQVGDGSPHQLLLKARIDNLALVDSSRIRILARNSEGTAESTSVLTIKERLNSPTMLEDLLDQVGEEEGKVTFSCTVRGKPLPDLISWYLKDVKLLPSEKIAISQTPIGSDLQLTLTISLLALKDNGPVKVTAKNSQGEISSSAKLIVKEKLWEPLFLTKPSDCEIHEDEKAFFSCTVSGKPTPEISWFKGDILLKQNSSIAITSEPKDKGIHHTLILSNLSTSDSSLIKVVASNSVGRKATEAKLTVKAMMAYFSGMLEDVSVREGMPARFVCQVCPPNAKVTWHLDDLDLSRDDPRYVITEKGDERHLEIVKTTRADTGKIMCVVEEELKCYADLTVEASETEVVSSRLFFEFIEDKIFSAIADFDCLQGVNAANSTMEIQSADETESIAVEKAAQRRWVVKRAYISRSGNIRIERWTVQSFVDYVCTSAEGLANVQLGILDDVKYSTQTVEFKIELTEKTSRVRWLKDGKPVPPTDGSKSSKYNSTSSANGLFHTLAVADVQPSDQGVYTFKVLRSETEAKVTGIEGGSDFHASLLKKAFHDRQQSLITGTDLTTNITSNNTVITTDNTVITTDKINIIIDNTVKTTDKNDNSNVSIEADKKVKGKANDDQKELKDLKVEDDIKKKDTIQQDSNLSGEIEKKPKTDKVEGKDDKVENKKKGEILPVVNPPKSEDEKKAAIEKNISEIENLLEEEQKTETVEKVTAEPLSEGKSDDKSSADVKNIIDKSDKKDLKAENENKEIKKENDQVKEDSKQKAKEEMKQKAEETNEQKVVETASKPTSPEVISLIEIAGTEIKQKEKEDVVKHDKTVVEEGKDIKPEGVKADVASVVAVENVAREKEAPNLLIDFESTPVEVTAAPLIDFGETEELEKKAVEIKPEKSTKIEQVEEPKTETNLIEESLVEMRQVEEKEVGEDTEKSEKKSRTSVSMMSEKSPDVFHEAFTYFTTDTDGKNAEAASSGMERFETVVTEEIVKIEPDTKEEDKTKEDA